MKTQRLKKYFFVFSLWIFSFLLGMPPLLFAQPSIIATMQEATPALVDITAENFAVAQSPRAAAAIDKGTGRLIILRNVKAAHFKKSGAGVIIDPSGLIVTNYHTVGGASKITVTLSDKTTVSASVIQVFQNEDFVFLHINPPYPLYAISFADSSRLQLNEEVFTVGHSDLLDQTISGGKIIGLGTSQNKRPGDNLGTDVFQVNINIYKGDSGGPLLNRRGELAGLMTAGQMEKDRSSFAIAANKIKKHYLEYLTTLQNKK